MASGGAKQYVGGAAPATLSGSISAVDTTFTISPFISMPTGGANGDFILVIGRGTASEEKIRCSSRVNGLVTVAAGGRGFDNTVAILHTLGDVVEHVLDADSLQDDNRHLYDTTRDDHTQYARTDGSRAITGAQTFRAGAIFTGTVLPLDLSGVTVNATTRPQMVKLPFATSVAVSNGLSGFARLGSYGGGVTHLMANAYWDGLAWQRDTTGQGSVKIEADPAGNVLKVSRAAAGAGAITWTDVLTTTTTGALAATGVESFFGAGAVSGTGSYVSIGDQGDSAIGNVYVAGKGSGTNVNLILRAKGTSATASTIQFQSSGGNVLGYFRPDSGLLLGQTPLFVGKQIGALYRVVQVLFGADRSGPGGVGRALYIS